MYRDRVYQTSTSTGTGAMALGAAPAGFRTFATAFGGAAAYYCIVNRDNPAEWEVGSFTVSGATMNRIAGNVLAGSSGAGTLVSFTAGTKDIFNSPPAAAMQTWDTYNPSGKVNKTGDSMSGLLTAPNFRTGGSAGATGYQINGGTDLSSVFVIKSGDSMSGLLTAPWFRTGGGPGNTGYQVAGGTDLASLFMPAGAALTGATGGGSGFDVGSKITSAYLSVSGSTVVLSVGTACNCNCACRC